MKHLTLFIIFSCLGVGIAKAQYTDLVNFTDTSGANPGAEPYGSLTLSGGVLYGMTGTGGANNRGVIFSYDPVGNVYTDLVNFNDTNGANPEGSLIFSGGIFYGMTLVGGANEDGVIFSYDPVGNIYTNLYSFNDTSGSNPMGSLTLAGGIFYGMTQSGGPYSVNGVIFSYDPIGNVYTDLVNFTGEVGLYPGANPYGSLTLLDGILYGMTFSGGANGYGDIFSYNPATNVFTDLFDFTITGGVNLGDAPYGSLTVSGGVLYGMTAYGGVYGAGVIFSYDPVGNVYTDLVDLIGYTGPNCGVAPLGSLTLSGGILYGMTSAGGANDDGNIFSYDPIGNVYTDLVDMTGDSGSNPGAEPVFCTLTLSGGVFYGMTKYGGTNGYGVVFSFKDTIATTGINNTCTGAGIKLFPNPNNGVFTIQSVTDQSSVAIYNLLGEKVFTQTLSLPTGQAGSAPAGNSINISAQPVGVYIYRILDEGGGLLDQGKIVIDR